MDTGYIHDGYTISGYIEGVPRLHRSLRFTFRPALAIARATVFSKIAASTDAEAEKYAAAAIKQHVSQWNMTKTVNGQEQPVELTISEINRIHPILKSKLFNVVLGDRPCDIDPDAAADEESDNDYSAELEAAVNGESSDRESLAAKN